MGRRGRLNIADERFFFITTTVVRHTKVFGNKIYSELLVKSIKHYQFKCKFNILAYVIMPSHYHWIVEAKPNFGTISSIMRDIKKYSAWDIMEEIEKNDPELMNIFIWEASNYPRHKRIFWMSRFDDEVIRNEKMFWTKFHYIRNNPVKAGLVQKPEDYRFFSARNYVLGNNSILKVDTSMAGVEKTK